MIKIDVRGDLKRLQRDLKDLERKQIPFAAAQAINAVAKRAVQAEAKNILNVFPTATPFTQRSVRMRRATKGNLTATVYIAPIAAGYLEPYQSGGKHYLGAKRGLLVPKNQPVDQYGNLPRGLLARLKGRPDIFIGPVKTANGTINGVWQRSTPTARGKGATRLNKGRNTTGRLKLLIRFEDPLPVKQSLGFGTKGAETVRGFLPLEFELALRRAMKTART